MVHKAINPYFLEKSTERSDKLYFIHAQCTFERTCDIFILFDTLNFVYHQIDVCDIKILRSFISSF